MVSASARRLRLTGQYATALFGRQPLPWPTGQSGRRSGNRQQGQLPPRPVKRRNTELMTQHALRGHARPSGFIQSVITSYGEGHHDAPSGNALRVDARPLRNPPDDPAVRERMLHSTGLDPEVRHYVMSTHGADQLVDRSVQRALALLRLPAPSRGQLHRVDVHVLCGGGRHRSVVLAEEISTQLQAVGIGCEVEHRHIDRPVLKRWGPQLTEHEAAVLHLLARGYLYTEIATALRVRSQTVGLLVARLRGVLRARTAAHAVAVGYETELLPVRPRAGALRRSSSDRSDCE
ncbi:hypothetical protein ACFV98_38820 [Streptomyces violascens]|uniref:RapZ C-terminal domain-containing protein n=1 Tax=Streptomyces violascens TaxID=67381 RepID=UPI00366A461E